MHISCGKDLAVSYAVTLISRNYCASLTELEAKIISHVILTPDKSGSDKQKIALKCLFRSGNLRELTILEFNLYGLNLLDMSLFIGLYVFYRGLEDSRVLAVYVNRFLMAVIGLKNLGSLRPWIACSALYRRLWHHLDGCNALSSVPYDGSDTVITRIATTYYNNIPALCIDIPFLSF